ncbi:GFA family protein [Acinetobacter pittii]|uniref:GFA family protein n=1 Tax=Acinetobacter calcoaceticus/baumannii complex TaxID=909768 RepID=UPI0009D73946|nr:MULTISPECIES: GFA family protein [Acinetobacter calcoaceticus/baumannii complex]MCG9492996.1 GFA family protein [Acinetobacter pittii]
MLEMSHIGSCLCNEVKFSITNKINTVYHCHCSLCRKQTGTGANAATLVSKHKFEWLSGLELVRTYKKETGFTSSFCSKCGSPVPNLVGSTDFMWIPLGLLDQDIVVLKKLNFCIVSKSNWVNTVAADQSYNQLPTLNELKIFFD